MPPAKAALKCEPATIIEPVTENARHSAPASISLIPQRRPNALAGTEALKSQVRSVAAMPAAMPTCRRNFRLVDLLDMCRGSMEGAWRQRPPHLQFARQLLAPCTGARADRHRQRAMMSHRRCRCKAGQAIPLTTSYFEVTSQVGLSQSAQTSPCWGPRFCPHRDQCARTGYK